MIVWDNYDTFRKDTVSERINEQSHAKDSKKEDFPGK